MSVVPVGCLVTKAETLRGGGVGGGPPSLDPYLLGRVSKPQTTISWRATSGHADCDSAWSREGGRPPAPPHRGIADNSVRLTSPTSRVIA